MNETFNNCPECHCTHFVKAGFNNGKQRYKCKGCNHYFSVKQRSNQKSNDIKKQAIDMYLEGLSFRSNCWTWIAIDRNSKQILGFVCDKRDTNTFKRLYQQLNTHNIQLFCSDYCKSYREVIPKPKHITSKAQTFTIEGYNSLIRHFIARFRRKSKCYSKSEKMIENTLNLLFAKWNGSLRYVF